MFTESYKQKELWDVVRKWSDPWHYSAMLAHGVSAGTAQHYVRRWEQLGRIRFVRRDERNRRYFLAAEKPLPGAEPVSSEATPEGNMWRAMRRLGQFSGLDVAAHSNVGEIEVTADKARSYCRQLLGSGHLRVVETAIPGRREAVYKLIEDTGPRPPRPARVTGMLDPNTGMFVPANPEVKV